MSPIKASEIYDLFFSFLDFCERVWRFLSNSLGEIVTDYFPEWVPQWVTDIVESGAFGILWGLSPLELVCGSGLALFFVLLIIKYIIPV